MSRVYTKADHARFVLDMESRGRIVEHYRGRNFYEGPATTADDNLELQDIIRATAVMLQWDNLGRGWIVYPR